MCYCFDICQDENHEGEEFFSLLVFEEYFSEETFLSVEGDFSSKKEAEAYLSKVGEGYRWDG